jgi:Mrp family chromosome partitioning ATPase
MLLAHFVDGVILVVKAGETAREVVVRAVDIMTTNKANVLGVVLNNSRNSLPYYYDYSHYHYDYSQRNHDGAPGSPGRHRGGRPPDQGGSRPGETPTQEKKRSVK